MKICNKCNQSFPLELFSKNKAARDGLSNSCKECVKKNGRKWYLLNRERNHERTKRWWGNNRERRLSEYKISAAKYRKENPIKRAAHIRVSNALALAKLEKKPCQYCGNEKSAAHHCDYSKPLEVVWMCQKHHMAWHRLFISEMPV